MKLPLLAVMAILFTMSSAFSEEILTDQINAAIAERKAENKQVARENSSAFLTKKADISARAAAGDSSAQAANKTIRKNQQEIAQLKQARREGKSLVLK